VLLISCFVHQCIVQSLSPAGRLSTLVSAAAGFHLQCIMWMYVYNICELTTYNMPREWQNAFTQLWTEILSINAFAAIFEESHSVVSRWIFKFSLKWGLNMSQWKTVVRFPILLSLLCKLGLGLTKSAIKSLPNDVSRGIFTSHSYYCRSILRCQRHENDLTLGRQNGKQRCRGRHFPNVFFVTLHVSLAFMLIYCTLLS
jgi:hypothetical protein